jgi:hypothetical protein
MELLLLTLVNDDEASPRDVVVTIRVVLPVIGGKGDVKTNASVIKILLGPRTSINRATIHTWKNVKKPNLR